MRGDFDLSGMAIGSVDAVRAITHDCHRGGVRDGDDFAQARVARRRGRGGLGDARATGTRAARATIGTGSVVTAGQ